MANDFLARKKLKTKVTNYIEKLKLKKILIKDIYIYGSYAKNQERSDSDIDLCIISPAFVDRIEATMMLMKIRNDNELLISPIAFSPKTFTDENPLAWEIKKTGVRI